MSKLSGRSICALKGLINRGWKDSWDGIDFTDGRVSMGQDTGRQTDKVIGTNHVLPTRAANRYTG
ncbi:hypothetical protein [Pseudarthrobacter siccitolerans]